MDLLKKIVNSPAVRKAFWVLAGAVATVIASNFGVQIPGLSQ
jgi:hypothetical protein